LDRFWDEMGATYMDFPRVLSRLRAEVENLVMFSPSISAMEATVYQTVNYAPYYAMSNADIYTLPPSDDDARMVDLELGLGFQGEVHNNSKSRIPHVPDFLSNDFSLDRNGYENESDMMGTFQWISPSSSSSNCRYNPNPTSLRRRQTYVLSGVV
jgi:hypothetical protein